MKRFLIILYAVLGALVVSLFVPCIPTGVQDGSSSAFSRMTMRHGWTLQDHVYYGLWKLRLRKEPPAIYEYEQLVELITRTVLPQSWDEVGGRGSVPGGSGCNGIDLLVEQEQVLREADEEESLALGCG
jgi:hypothetical protein